MEDLPLSARLVEALRGLGVEELFPPQEEAVRRGLLSGRSLVVSSPTGSGKSLIALMAALAALERGRRVAYLAPLRSLVYERAAEWRRVLEPLGHRVAVATGDYDRVEPWLGGADALLLTYEKMDSLLRHGAEFVKELGLLVVDEAHYIGDPKRGPVLETVVARLRGLNPGMQVVAMSATIPNAEELARWLGAELVVSDWRPVPLREGVAHRSEIVWSDGTVTGFERLTGNPTLDAALDAVAAGGQALVFVQSRRKAVELAQRLLGEAEARRRVAALLPRQGEPQELLSRGEHRSLNALLARLASRGIGFHHAGLASYQREVVEKLFRSRRLRVLFATPTLAAGVNLPARRVVVDSLYRYAGGRSEPIPVAEYKQLAGRAGRPGLDERGEAVIVARSERQASLLYRRYIHGAPEPIVSKLVSTKALRSQVLAVAAPGVGRDELHSVFAATFYALQFGEPRAAVDEAAKTLLEMGMLEESNGWLKATRLGRRASELYIDPLTAHRMVEGLKRLWTSKLFIHDALFLALWNSDAVLLRPPRGLQASLEAEAEEYLEGLGFNPYSLSDYDVAQAAQALYTVDALVDWVSEIPEDRILEKYGIDPGDLRAVTETATWLVYSMQQLAEITGHPAAEWLRRLEVMVKHGVREELVELVKVPQVGRVRARILYQAGVRSLEDLASLEPARLAELVPGLGLARAEEIVAAARLLVSKRRGGERTASA